MAHLFGADEQVDERMVGYLLGTEIRHMADHDPILCGCVQVDGIHAQPSQALIDFRLVALIGKQWLTITDEDGRRRLENPEDYVRLEIAAALKRDIRVTPLAAPRAVRLTSHSAPHPTQRTE